VLFKSIAALNGDQSLVGGSPLHTCLQTVSPCGSWGDSRLLPGPRPCTSAGCGTTNSPHSTSVLHTESPSHRPTHNTHTHTHTHTHTELWFNSANYWLMQILWLYGHAVICHHYLKEQSVAFRTVYWIWISMFYLVNNHLKIRIVVFSLPNEPLISTGGRNKPAATFLR